MRDEFTTKTIERLAKRAGVSCSNPGCGRSTSGPGLAPGSVVNIGVAAHITAASTGGPRYDASLSGDLRRSYSNGIWLCEGCAKLIDSDVTGFPASLLHGWKQHAERQAQVQLQGTSDAKRVAVLRRTLKGHTNYVWDVVVTPDGRRVLSASNDTTVRMWDVVTGNHLATFGPHEAFVCSISVSADGSLLAAGAADGSIKVWELASGSLFCTLHHGSSDAKVDFVNGKSCLISGGSDGHLREWSLRYCAERQSIRAHEEPILKVVCLDDGARTISVSCDRTIKLFTLSAAECLRVWQGHVGEVNSVAISADKRHVISASVDKTIRLWDVESGECRATLCGHSDIVWRVAISANCRIAASGSADNTVRIWDLQTGQCIQELPHPDCVAAVAFGPDGSTLAVGCDDSKVYIYDIDCDATESANG